LVLVARFNFDLGYAEIVGVELLVNLLQAAVFFHKIIDQTLVVTKKGLLGRYC